MFKPGDLLECIANDVTNPKWKGIKPEIGQYYTWRGNSFFSGIIGKFYGYVEEIISPIDPASNREFVHDKKWYRKVDVNVNIEELMKETELQEI